MTAGLATLRRAFAEGLRPEPDHTVSSWADSHRTLSTKESPEPGPWRTERTPYLAEIMDVLSPSSPVERAVFMKSSQVGGSEVLNNFLGFVIAHAPGPMLLVQPTVNTAKRYSKQRIAPMIQSTPALRERVRPAREREGGNTLQAKEFPGGILLITGANSAADLTSAPIRYLAGDEVDRWPVALNEEGDPLAQAEQRTANFRRRKILLVSTPTVKGLSRIEREYERSDQRRFWTPCPDCGAFQVLRWAQVQWPEDKPEEAEYVCPDCGSCWSDVRRLAAVGRGEWRASAEFRGTAGFHISALSSPWVRLGRLASDFLEAKKLPETLQAFVNLKLGELWEERLAEIDPTGLRARAEDYPADPVPAGVGIITCGVDVQDDRLELEVVGWGRGGESWSLDYRVLWGDPTGPALWGELDHALETAYEHAHGPKLRIAATCIDAGHLAQTVYQFVKPRFYRRVWAVKGRAGAGQPVMGRPRRNNTAKVHLFPVGVDEAKTLIYQRLQVQEPGPGYCHFPQRYGPEYFSQLVAEKVRTKYHRGFPRREWILPPGVRNEALDCRVYALAAAEGMNIDPGSVLDTFEESEPEESPRRLDDGDDERGDWVSGGGRWSLR
ncbi:MAG TPA: phage terminase large subunit family protein [Candidatus Limnocylindrales bacterium]|nr:phage terminase large subunit family protein [Candidatus Limnocylindrales bacterium]